MEGDYAERKERKEGAGVRRVGGGCDQGFGGTRAIRTATSSITTPRGEATSLSRRAQPLLLLFRSTPPH